MNKINDFEFTETGAKEFVEKELKGRKFTIKQIYTFDPYGGNGCLPVIAIAYIDDNGEIQQKHFSRFLC